MTRVLPILNVIWSFSMVSIKISFKNSPCRNRLPSIRTTLSLLNSATISTLYLSRFFKRMDLSASIFFSLLNPTSVLLSVDREKLLNGFRCQPTSCEVWADLLWSLLSWCARDHCCRCFFFFSDNLFFRCGPCSGFFFGAFYSVIIYLIKD